MTVAKPQIRYTYEDYRTLPEDLSRRHELLQGELLMVPAPTTLHQRVLRKLGDILNRHVTANHAGEVFYAPLDVVLGVGDAREVAQPDIMFVSASRSAIVRPQGIEGAPELVVEIVSPGTAARDRGYKRALYLRHGVLEYWIVDPDVATMEVQTSPSSYTVYRRADVMQSALFPGLNIDLDQFL